MWVPNREVCSCSLATLNHTCALHHATWPTLGSVTQGQPVSRAVNWGCWVPTAESHAPHHLLAAGSPETLWPWVWVQRPG